MTEFKLEDDDAVHVAELIIDLAGKDKVLERIVSNNNAGLAGEIPEKTLKTMGRVIVAQIVGAGSGN
jgi:hypothetical protein